MDLATLYNFLQPFAVATLYPGNRPESSVFPCLTYKQIADLPDTILSGALQGTSSARIQIDIYSLDHNQTNTLAKQLRTALCGYSGVMGLFYSGLTSGQLNNLTAQQYAVLPKDGTSCWVISVKLNDDLENPENAADSGDDWVYQRTLDFQIRYAI
jgi:hypothetical protein